MVKTHLRRWVSGSLVIGALMVAAASTASAFTLRPALSMGAGKWGVLGGAISTVFDDVSTQILTSGVLFYGGITNRLDWSAGFGIASLSNLPAGTTFNSAALYGLGLKYQFIDEFEGRPFSLAAALEFTNSRSNIAAGGAPVSLDVAEPGVRLVVSRLFMQPIPVIPYAGLAYKMISNQTTTPAGTTITTGTGLEYSLGTFIAFSRQGTVFVEYTGLKRSAAGATPAGTTTQVSGGVTWNF